MIAVTNIEHDGKLIKADSTVSKSDFTSDNRSKEENQAVYDALVASGAIVDKTDGLSEEDKSAKIAALRAELADLETTAGGPVPPTPGQAAEDLAKADAASKEANTKNNK